MYLVFVFSNLNVLLLIPGRHLSTILKRDSISLFVSHTNFILDLPAVNRGNGEARNGVVLDKIHNLP